MVVGWGGHRRPPTVTIGSTGSTAPRAGVPSVPVIEERRGELMSQGRTRTWGSGGQSPLSGTVNALRGPTNVVMPGSATSRGMRINVVVVGNNLPNWIQGWWCGGGKPARYVVQLATGPFRVGTNQTSEGPVQPSAAGRPE